MASSAQKLPNFYKFKDGDNVQDTIAGTYEEDNKHKKAELITKYNCPELKENEKILDICFNIDMRSEKKSVLGLACVREIYYFRLLKPGSSLS